MAGRTALESSGLDSQPSLCKLPGDPSLILTTNVDLGEQKLGVMKLCSKAIAEHTGKPESYVGKFVHLWLPYFDRHLDELLVAHSHSHAGSFILF
jgi:hypothetical protein